MRKGVVGCLGVIIILGLIAPIMAILYTNTKSVIFIWIIIGCWIIFGNWLTFFYKEKTDNGDAGKKVNNSERLARYILLYGGALLFILLSAQLIFKGFVLGLGIGIEYLPNAPEPYENLSWPRHVSWLIAAVLFALTSVALAFRDRRAVILMATGTVILFLGAAHDRFLLEPGTYEPEVESDFTAGIGLTMWVLGTIFLRMRGAFR